MQIVSFVSADMGNLDHISIAALVTGEVNPAIGDGLHWGACRSRIVSSQMRAADFQNWVIPMQAEMRTHTRREAKRRTQKSFLQRLAISGVIRRVALRIV